MKRERAEDRFSMMVEMRRIHEYRPIKKRKYENIRQTAKQIREYIKQGKMIDLYWNAKYDYVFCDVYQVGKAKHNNEYTLFITTLHNLKNERELRKILDEVIQAKSYDRIHFS